MEVTASQILLSLLIASFVIITCVAIFYLWFSNLLKRRLHEFVDQSSQALILQGTEMLFWSKKAAELIGFSQIQAMGHVAELIDENQQSRFLMHLDVLMKNGKGFEGSFDLLSGRVISIKGEKTRIFRRYVLVLWFQDISELSLLADNYVRMEQDSRIQSAIIDSLPYPIWWRSTDDLNLLDCNKAYAEYLEKDKDIVISEQHELGAGSISAAGRFLARRAARSSSIQTESHSVALQGKRRLLEFTEQRHPNLPHLLTGYALDMTALDDVQAQLVTHLAAHDTVLDEMLSAIVIFGPDKRLTYFNQSFMRLFDLHSSDVAAGLGYGEVLEKLRQKRKLPEVIDFPKYKREQEALFSRLLEKKEEMLHLPDGRTLHQLIIPHPLGGLMWMLEDVTDLLSLESNYNTQIAVQQETLNNLFDAVSVWGSDGKLNIWNRMFKEFWQFPKELLDTNPHITEIVDFYHEKWLANEDELAVKKSKSDMILQITERVAKSYTLALVDGRVIEVALVPLPDAQVLVIHSDVTDTKRVERALEERNVAFERADLLKTQFLSNVSYELRTPINAIQGFASILKEEYFGTLNERQMNHVQNILDAGETLTQLVKDILDLAIIQADLMELELEESDIAQLINKSIEDNKALVMDEKQQLTCFCEPGVYRYKCDQGRLERALSNLLGSILKLSDGDHVDIQLSDFPDHLCIRYQTDWVLDHKEDQKYIQNRFMGNDPQALRSGVGLNLSIARNMVELHGGEIQLDVTSEKGFAVTIVLKKA
ncbi:PAS-domain containing protein [Curvivirga sp.]|uniref:PAS domain-containing sensor histidine kinase n=1 Tax=Curvivirga sp. TaxID=2856848 RepID=UPI003B5B1B53